MHVRDAVGWRVRRLVGDQPVDRLFVQLARRWRPLLTRQLFVGIGGSAAKTTTKDLVVSILSRKGNALGNRRSLNATPEVAKTILRVRPKHDFCVTELAERDPGSLDEPLALLRPSIGIVTVIGEDHWRSFESREAIAAEVGKLVACLPATGTAVLNADDTLVLAMAEQCAGKIITYGVSPQADLRAEDVHATWPDRLQLTVVRGAERVPVRTQLCGSHWIPSVLGAIGGGLAAGLTLDECAQGIATVPPFEGRMQPVTTPDGVTFIRDDFKAPLWTLEACFDFMRAARSKRKIIVIGTVSDYDPPIESTYRSVAKRAQQIADVTIFVGPWASSVLKGRKPGRDDSLCAFSHVRDAGEFLNSITRDGDLVLLKGTNNQDHLLRIILARTGDIACWRDNCKRDFFCNECPERTQPSGTLVPPRTESLADTPPRVPVLGRPSVGATEPVLVGLGNPETRYAGTPHNIGYEVLDRMADALGLTWETFPDAWIARGAASGQSVCLIKMRVAINLTGAALKQLADELSFSPEQCVLVHDDLDIPLGSVRLRQSGSAGGHRGVASILEAFQTDALRRVKIGVGHPNARLNRAEYVVTPFAPSDRVTVEQALSDAEARALVWITSKPKTTSSHVVVESSR